MYVHIFSNVYYYVVNIPHLKFCKRIFSLENKMVLGSA